MFRSINSLHPSSANWYILKANCKWWKLEWNTKFKVKLIIIFSTFYWRCRTQIMSSEFLTVTLFLRTSTVETEGWKITGNSSANKEEIIFSNSLIPFGHFIFDKFKTLLNESFCVVRGKGVKQNVGDFKVKLWKIAWRKYSRKFLVSSTIYQLATSFRYRSYQLYRIPLSSSSNVTRCHVFLRITYPTKAIILFSHIIFIG